MNNFHYLVKISNGIPNGISVPALFSKDNNQTLYANRDVQFSLLSQIDEVHHFILIKSCLTPGKLIKHLRDKQQANPRNAIINSDNKVIENDQHVTVLKEFKFVCNPIAPLQNDLKMKLYAMNETQYYMCFPEIYLQHIV
jgi:hypothetical protein